MRSRKGQTSANGAATTVLVVTALIVIYILFLPPQERAALLGEDGGGSSGGSSGGSTSRAPSMNLLNEQVGHIDYLKSTEREHLLPSFRVSTKTEGSMIKEVGSVYVKSSVFDSVIENVTFKLDTDLSSSVRLSFNTGKAASGRLIILLNNQQIINDELDKQSSKVIELPVEQLQRYNTLTIGVSSPGWAFWQVNEYFLNTIQISADVTDVSEAQSRQTFVVEDEELELMESADLEFYADCVQESVGRLDIKLNGRMIFSSMGDCGILNKIELDPHDLDVGDNELTFTTAKGSYLLTNLVVDVELEEPVYPIYYFDMDEAYFSGSSSSDEETCGDIDGVCPDDCSEDRDKDCCFAEGDNYWCDVQTAQLNDRCVSFVTESTCDRCESGYEDDRGRSAEDCEESCGDDRDGECPAGCSKYLDKDCCFEDGDNYWCDDIPSGQLFSAVCRLGVEPDERSSCPDRYYNEDGKRLSYTADESDDDEELRSGYEVLLALEFPNDDLKSAAILVNGREVGLESRKLEFEKDISSYVHSGTNSLQIEPARSIDVTSLKVDVKRK